MEILRIVFRAQGRGDKIEMCIELSQSAVMRDGCSLSLRSERMKHKATLGLLMEG